jgi:anaerobic selenocysteine-containing dehydrogenase
VHPLPRHELGAGELLLTTLRSHDQFNTTIYGENDRYRGISKGRRVLFINEEDIAERGLTGGSFVDLISRFGREQRRAERFRLVPYEIPRGSVAAYYPEANVLVPLDSVSEGSNQPAFKSVIIRIEPSPAALQVGASWLPS